MTSSAILTGVVHGRTVELDCDAGLPDGQVVHLAIISAAANGHLQGEGLRQSAGAWADAGPELDQWLQEIQSSRQQEREVA